MLIREIPKSPRVVSYRQCTVGNVAIDYYSLHIYMDKRSLQSRGSVRIKLMAQICDMCGLSHNEVKQSSF